MASARQPAEGRPGSTAEGGGFGPLYLGAFLIYGDRFAIAPMLLTIADDLDEPLAAVTIIATLYFLLYGIMQFPYGLASDRVGRVRVMRFALLGLAVADLGAALAPTLPLLIAAKALAAGTAAAVLPTSLVYVGDRVPFDRRQRVIANVLAAGSLGTTLATIGGGLAARLDVWRAVFAAFAVLALVAGLALGRLPESLPQARTGGTLTRVRSVFRSRWAVLVIVLAVAEGTVMVGLLTYLPPALEASGQTAAVAGLVVAAYGVAVFTCMQLLKLLLRQRAPHPAALIAIGGALLTAAWTVAAAAQDVLAIVTASALVGLGYSFAHSTLQTWATEVAPQARATATSLFVTGVYTGAAIGAGAMSGLADAGRYGLLFALAAAATVPIMTAAALARRRYAAT